MTNVIVTDAQSLEIVSPIIELFELTIGTVPVGQAANTNKLYFHAAKDLEGADSNKDLIFDGNTYITLPILMEDIERKTGGTMNRPKLTIANVESMIKTGAAFRTQIDDGTWNSEIDGEAITPDIFRLDHLVGQRLERRRTLEKYTGSEAAFEFDREVFIIDRISSVTPIFCELELSSPADIGGLRIPNRQVIGKYCPWVYQGYPLGVTKSACEWHIKDHIKIADEDDKYSFYFTQDDEPLVLASHLTGSDTDAWKGIYDSNEAYGVGEYVSHKTVYTTTVNGAVSSPSTVVTLDAKSTNSKIQAGYVVTGLTGSGTITVVQIAGTYLKVNSAVTVSDEETLNFTSPSNYYRATVAHAAGGVAPEATAIQWNLVRTYTTWSNSTTYTIHPNDAKQNPYVRHSDTVWRAVQTNLNVEPGTNDAVWTRGDVCGKLLNSCKIRYQAIPMITGSASVRTNAVPDYENDTNKSLPFGGFPGSKKFR